MRDTWQPFDARIADVAIGPVEAWETERYVLLAPDDQRWRSTGLAEAIPGTVSEGAQKGTGRNRSLC
ncbi:MAG: hypothetical protein ACREDM_12380 [Methylocella sp.]